MAAQTAEAAGPAASGLAPESRGRRSPPHRLPPAAVRPAGRAMRARPSPNLAEAPAPPPAPCATARTAPHAGCAVRPSCGRSPGRRRPQKNQLARARAGQGAACALEPLLPGGEAHLKGARDPVEVEDGGAKPSLGGAPGAESGDRMGRAASRCRAVCAGVERQPICTAQQQQPDMERGMGRANGGVVQEHREDFGQGADRGELAATLRPGQGVGCRHVVTARNTQPSPALRSPASQTATCVRWSGRWFRVGRRMVAPSMRSVMHGTGRRGNSQIAPE